MNRRAFIGALTGSLLAARCLARAQQAAAKVRRIGYLSPGRPGNPIEPVFEKSMRDLGYVEGQNIRLERRYSEQPGALPALAVELVSLGVDVLVVWSPVGALAAKQATSELPVVFLAVGDPVSFGLVSSETRPGGNLTGVSFDVSQEIYAKSLQLLKETVPTLTRVALLASSEIPQPKSRQRVLAAAKELMLQVHDVVITSPAEMEVAIRNAKDRGAQALDILPSGMAYSFRKQLADLALSYRLASIHPFREGVVAGGLLSYAASLAGIAERGAFYVDKILKGTKPGDLPVEQPTKFELVINLKTAKVLGLTIPPSLLARADQVIE
jgi:putative tryptophan/tyrosine transport system substrate-binding protein